LITSYLRQPDGAVVSPASDEQVRQAVSSGQGQLWIDLEAVTERAEAAFLSDVFGFHHLTIDDCFNRHVDPAKIDDYGRYIFIIAQGMSTQAPSGALRTTEIDIYLGTNYVVSFHQEPLPGLEAVRRRVLAGGPDFAHGVDFLTHALLDAVVDGFQPEVEMLDDTLSHLEERVLAQPEAHLLEEILTMKRNVQRLRRTLVPQRDMVNRIARGEFPTVVQPETHMYFRDVYDHVVRVGELVETLRDLADGALNVYLGSVNNRMNDIMKTLSVVASVILPLPFIASIYGMNFENMPELEWEYGYFLILAVMAAIGVGLVTFFRTRRWF
jgi:magnesium transporter